MGAQDLFNRLRELEDRTAEREQRLDTLISEWEKRLRKLEAQTNAFLATKPLLEEEALRHQPVVAPPFPKSLKRLNYRDLRAS